MILTLLLMIAGFAAGYLIAALWRNQTKLRLMKSQSPAFDAQRKELDAALNDALKTNKRLQDAVLALEASRMKAIRAWQKAGYPGRLHDALGITESELHAFVRGHRTGQHAQADLNQKGFISGLNEDMRQDILREAAEEGNFFRALGKAVFDEETRRREDIEAKIGAWHNSDHSGSLHEYLGMTEAELDAFAKYAERVHSGDPD